MPKIKVDIYNAKTHGGSSAVKLCRFAAKAAFWHLYLGFDAAVDITFTDEKGILEKNLAFRNINSATDVLSFPMADFKAGIYIPPLPLGPDGRVMLGDIVISLSRAQQQAQEYGHSLARECAYLTVHSLLHLCGFDHEKAEDKRLMRHHEELIMKSLNLGRQQ